MIGLLKMALSISQSGWKEIRNALPVIRWVRREAQNKDLGATSQTLLTGVWLPLQRRLFPFSRYAAIAFPRSRVFQER